MGHCRACVASRKKRNCRVVGVVDDKPEFGRGWRVHRKSFASLIYAFIEVLLSLWVSARDAILGSHLRVVERDARGDAVGVPFRR